MVPQPEQEARKAIDTLLVEAGWSVCDADKTNIHGARGVAIREFPLKSGHGLADYLLYVDGKAAGVIEAKGSARWEQGSRTSTRGCEGLATSGAGMRSEVTGSDFQLQPGAIHYSLYVIR